jgi:hypothetical protein
MEHHGQFLQIILQYSHLLCESSSDEVSELRLDVDECLVWMANTDLGFKRRWDSLLVDSYKASPSLREGSLLLERSHYALLEGEFPDVMLTNDRIVLRKS